VFPVLSWSCEQIDKWFILVQIPLSEVIAKLGYYTSGTVGHRLQPKILDMIMRGWGPNLLRGRGKSIGGDLDVDDEGSE
jgi:hypothetical protein